MNSNTPSNTPSASWPFISSREQLDTLTALAMKIEEVLGEVDETITAAGFPTDVIPDFDHYAQAVYCLQSLLRYWSDYSGYAEVAS